MRTMEYVKALAMVLVALAILIAIWFTATGCVHDGCEPETMRCKGNNVEECNADADWYVVEHCDGEEPVDLDWVCCYVEAQGLFACVPAEECEE